MRPRSGWFQRTSASAAATLPVASSTIGCSSTTSSPRSAARWRSSLRRWRRRTAACIAGSKTSWRCLPAFLAVYMATSALRSSSSALSTSAVQPSTIPRLACAEISCPATVKGRSSSAMTRSATRVTAALSLDVVQEHGELVAAQARREVARLQRAAQAPGDGLQQLVADRMAERVVDRLEVVEVEEEDRVVAPARGEQLAELVEEQRAVGQAGQRVVVGLVLEAALQLAQLGDEVLQPVVLQRHAGVVGQRAEEREVVAVEAPDRAAVGDQEGADHPRLARERGEHRALMPRRASAASSSGSSSGRSSSRAGVSPSTSACSASAT